MVKYQVIYTDYGDSCDYKARSLGVYKTFKAAHKAMMDDTKIYQNAYHEAWDDETKDLPIAHEDNDSIMLGSEEYGCQWQILELEVNNETKTKKAKSNSS